MCCFCVILKVAIYCLNWYLQRTKLEISSLGCRNVKVLSSYVQESANGLNVLVKGSFLDKNKIEKLFMQVFVLDAQYKGFLISVDMLRTLHMQQLGCGGNFF